MSNEPVSILDRDQQRPIVVESDTTPDLVIPLVILIIFIVFIGWMSYLLISSGFQTTSPGNPVSSDKRVETNIVCAPGQCATDLQSGFKTCPVNEIDSITVNPAQAVCNSPFVCDNLLTPYAVQSDQSTNISGVCEPNTECPCLKVSQCADYILSAFTTSNGNPYESLGGQRITFPQNSSYVANDGSSTDNPPLQFNNPSITFCAASLAWLPLSNPGCNFVSAANGNSMNIEDLILCMGMANPGGCSGVFGNACLQGTLALLSSNPDTVTPENISRSQYACVRGEPCPCGQITIFDTNYGGVVCRNIS